MKRSLILTSICVFLTVAATGSSPAGAARNAYLKFDGVDGEAVSMDHEAWIELESLSNATRATRAGSTARRRGDVVLEDIVVAKEVDKSSPKLAEAVCKGKVFPKVEIHVTASYSDTGRQTYHTYELTNVRVSSYSVSASDAGAAPTEEFSLNFEQIKTDYDKTGRALSKARGRAETTWKVEKGE